MAFGLVSCYQAQKFRTPDMDIDSEGGDGVWETWMMRFLASEFVGVAALGVARYFQWEVTAAAKSEV